MIHGVRLISQDISYISKQHSCPVCNTPLNVIKLSKVINSGSKEAKNLPPILPPTVIGSRKVKFRSYSAVGNIKCIWREFECPNCCHRFSVEHMKQIEASPQEDWNEMVASFDKLREQTYEEVVVEDDTATSEKNGGKALKIALCISIPATVLTLLLIAVIVLSISNNSFVDTNGPDNFALTEITQSDILAKDFNYTSSMVSKRYSGRHTNFTGTKFRELDYDYISSSFGKFHGISILQATKTDSDTLTININSSVKSGNAEILIIIDGQYYCSVDVNCSQTVKLKDISNKEVLVKLAGESAKIQIDISRTY